MGAEERNRVPRARIAGGFASGRAPCPVARRGGRWPGGRWRPSLIEAVRAASTGEGLISPAVTVRLLRQLTAVHHPGGTATSRLSDRERDIARCIAIGRTNQEIAAELFISLSTVKTHIARIQHKLGVRNRVEIAAWAWENRIVDRGANPEASG